MALHAKDETELALLGAQLAGAGVPFMTVCEPDAPYNGALMAIGIVPTTDRMLLRRYLSSFPLIK